MTRGRTLPLLATAYFFHYGSVGLQVPFASPALLSLGFSAAVVGSLWAVRSSLAVLAPTLWGVLADRAGSGRPFAAFALASGGLTLGALSIVESEAAATVAFACYGLVGAASAPLLDGLTLTALGEAKHRYGRVRLFGALGFGVLALAGNEAVGAGVIVPDAAHVFPIAGSLHLVGALAVLLTPKLPRARAARLSTLAAASRASGLGWLALVGVLQWASHGAYHAFVTPLAELKGFGPRVVGFALAAAIACEVLMMRLSSRILARFDAERVLVLVLFITVLRWAGLAVADSAGAFIVLNALHGVSFGLFFTTSVALLAARMPDAVRQGAQGLLTSLFFGVGGALGAALAGLVLDDGARDEHSAARAWGAMAAVALVPLVVVVLRIGLRERRSRRAQG